MGGSTQTPVHLPQIAPHHTACTRGQCAPLQVIQTKEEEVDAEEGKERAQLALDVFASRIHKYIGSYATRMHGVDVIVFTAGVGENSSTVRAKVLEGLEFMGIYWDPKKNETIRGEEGFINYPHSPVKVIVIPTNEEVMIARDTVKFGEL